MERRFALKRLTASDLTFFSWHHRNRNVGNQKAINLNADVFISVLFPALPDAAIELGGRLPLDLSLYGPGYAGLHNVQRKIVKFGTYKNWRLNGEFINDPDGEAERYNVLRPGDLAVFEFSGRIYPTAAKLILISQILASDQAIFQRLVQHLGDRVMVAVSASELQALTEGLPPNGHAYFELTIEDELEDAALGGAKGRSKLWRRPSSQVLSRSELERARERAEEVGRIGEELVYSHLQKAKANGEIKEFAWVSDINVVAPYDFLVTLQSGQELAIDVKATNGGFERPIHVSIAELHEMCGARRYDLYRVFELSEDRGKLRILENGAEFASRVLERIAELPPGVQVNSFSADPAFLPFGQTVETIIATGSEGEVT